MADDGMVLNFDLGAGAPLKPRVKVKGGSWRERAQLQKSLKDAARNPNAVARKPPVRREPVETSAKEDHGDARPTKRFKVDSTTSRPIINNSIRHGHGHGPGGNPQVTSSLFSFNPTAVTKFDHDPDAKEAEDAEPSNAPLAEDSFKALGLSDRLIADLAKLQLDKPTAIQKKAIPPMLTTTSDVFLQAETGSGKTLAYVLPMLQKVLALSQSTKIHRDSGVFGIVLTPTRELAKQTYEVVAQLLRATPWLVATPIVGGESKKAEKARIRKGVNFIIATPGRLGDHLQNTKVLKLSTVRWLVLDEGDRLMELGFEEDIQKVIAQLGRAEVAMETYDGASLAKLPERRVTVLCSATMKMSVQKLGDMSLKDAIHVEASKEERDEGSKGEGEDKDKDKAQDTTFSAPAQLKQSYLVAPAKLRLVTLISYLKFTFARKGSVMKAIIFISCADSVDFHFELLKAPADQQVKKDEAEGERASTASTVGNAAYITSAANKTVVLHRLHGSLSQPIRTATLRSFSTSKEPAVLITTDIASRGLDIPSVDLVVELDPAFSVADHIHRIGRTARAGRAGKAAIFLQPGCEEGYVSAISSGASAPVPQSYDAVLQQGLSIPMELPFETHAKMPEAQSSYTDKAEALQLHLEQRLLEDRKRLELARNGFKSHVRAYATHVKEERVYFDMTKLHLGHVAKSFCLREAPGGIGNGIDRKASKAGRAKRAREEGGGPGGDADGGGEVDGGRQLFMKMGRQAARAGASEFNLG